jgi:hypothetical protein
MNNLQEALAKFKFPAFYHEDDRCIYDAKGMTIVELILPHVKQEDEQEFVEAFTDFLNRASQPEKRDVYTVDKETELLYPIIRKNGEFFMAIHSGEDDAKIITDELNRLAGVHRSEFICERCLLRQDDTFPKNHDF